MTSDRIAKQSMRAWSSAGRWMGHRPFQMIGLLLGCILAVILIAYSTYQSADNDLRLDDIQEVLCSSSRDDAANPQRIKNCQELLNQLLKNPTPEQAERLRQIVKVTP